MFHPSRGGTRGGAADFSWEAVKNDKSREHYLGHSIMAPTGRWAKGKDVTWYNKGGDSSITPEEKSAKRKEELDAVKKQEEEAMAAVLGFKPIANPVRSSDRSDQGTSGAATGSNSAAGPMRKWGNEEQKHGEIKELEEGMSKEDRKAAKALAKMQVKQQRREERHRHRDERSDRHPHDRHRLDRRHHHHHHRSLRGRHHRGESRDEPRDEPREDRSDRHARARSPSRPPTRSSRHHDRSLSPSRRHRSYRDDYREHRHRRLERTSPVSDAPRPSSDRRDDSSPRHDLPRAE